MCNVLTLVRNHQSRCGSNGNDKKDFQKNDLGASNKQLKSPSINSLLNLFQGLPFRLGYYHHHKPNSHCVDCCINKECACGIHQLKQINTSRLQL